jgi:hypothetical protein
MAKSARITLPKRINLNTKIMIVIWELTQGDGTKFVSAAELKTHLGLSEEYLKKVCEAMTKGLRPRLVPKEAHLNEEQVGRKATLGYRIAEEAVIIQETARILIELLKSHDAHRVNRNKFVERMVSGYGMDADEVNERIDEGIKFGYIEKVPKNSLRGREVINQEIDYLTYLADKVLLRSTPQDTIQLASTQKTTK